MTTVLKFYLSIFNFCLKVLTNCLFFFMIFSVVFKKLSRFSIEPLFKIWFGVISYCYLVLDIFLVSSIGLRGIRDKEVSRYVQNPERNIMKLYIMSSKTLCFFIQKWPKIIRYYLNFKINKKTRLFIWFAINNVE